MSASASFASTLRTSSSPSVACWSATAVMVGGVFISCMSML